MIFAEQEYKDGARANSRAAGIRIIANPGSVRAFQAHLEALDLLRHVAIIEHADATTFALNDERMLAWIPGFDTTTLSARLELDTFGSAQDFERETLLAMLAAPRPFDFPNYDELAAALRIRRNIAWAAYRTQLAFETNAAERPSEYWTYDEDTSFTILPGKSLIAALKTATQPDVSGKLYSFSCYRATEYVILLGIAEELAEHNPALYQTLSRRWEKRAIMSGLFHEVFLREYGSLAEPIPPGYYVPGDRVWFRNPDAYSSDVSGFEGSWVFYMGGGLFSNFWNRQHFTMQTKCVEVFHWRDGVYTDANGDLRMNEDIVAERAHETLADPEKCARVMAVMMKLRDGPGIYADGGCIDASREFPLQVCPGTAEIEIPQA